VAMSPGFISGHDFELDMEMELAHQLSDVWH